MVWFDIIWFGVVEFEFGLVFAIVDNWMEENPYFFTLWSLVQVFADSSKLFVGMQPTFKHVPPRVPLDSTQAVLKPNCADLIAQT